MPDVRQAIVDASEIGAAIGLVFFLTSQLCGRWPACVGAVLLTGSASAFAVYTAKAVLPPGSAPGRTPAGVLLAVVTGIAIATLAARLLTRPGGPLRPSTASLHPRESLGLPPGVHRHVRGLRRGAGRRFRGGRHQGLQHGLHVGIVVAAYNTAWPNHVLCITWFAVRRLLPWRFMRFLALLHAGEILRQEGAPSTASARWSPRTTWPPPAPRPVAGPYRGAGTIFQSVAPGPARPHAGEPPGEQPGSSPWCEPGKPANRLPGRTPPSTASPPGPPLPNGRTGLPPAGSPAPGARRLNRQGARGRESVSRARPPAP
ncbi:hypothetical protein GCM10010309_69280 [Streptomyces violaceochromogenes]|nr:hypothetical protein GCM10010309_69280 [Streptomyces violaceochromogenes]